MSTPAQRTTAWSTAVDQSGINRVSVAVALATIALGAAFILQTISGRQAGLFLVGVAAGVVLYHASFGFTSSWRSFIVDRRGAGVRAQMLMLAVTCLVFFPALAAGSLLGQPVRGSVSPVSVSIIAGAFMFGVGMQLGGGCASGTLFTVGGGSTRMLVTLASFIAGSVLGATQLQRWEALPAFKPTSLVATMGPSLGLAASLIVFGAIAALTIVAERARHGSTIGRETRGDARQWSILRGPWPLFAGALGLARGEHRHAAARRPCRGASRVPSCCGVAKRFRPPAPTCRRGPTSPHRCVRRN